MPNDGDLYLSIYIEKCKMIFNMRVGPVITQITNTQKMNNSDMSTKKIPNSRVCYLDKSNSKSINTDESE